MSRDLFLGHSRFMACYSSNKLFIFFTENNWQELYKMHRNACQCSGMRSDAFQTSDKYTVFGGRPVHWPTTKNYLFDSCF